MGKFLQKFKRTFNEIEIEEIPKSFFLFGKKNAESLV